MRSLNPKDSSAGALNSVITLGYTLSKGVEREKDVSAMTLLLGHYC